MRYPLSTTGRRAGVCCEQPLPRVGSGGPAPAEVTGRTPGLADTAASSKRYSGVSTGLSSAPVWRWGTGCLALPCRGKRGGIGPCKQLRKKEESVGCEIN